MVLYVIINLRHFSYINDILIEISFQGSDMLVQHPKKACFLIRKRLNIKTLPGDNIFQVIYRFFLLLVWYFDFSTAPTDAKKITNGVLKYALPLTNDLLKEQNNIITYAYNQNPNGTVKNCYLFCVSPVGTKQFLVYCKGVGKQKANWLKTRGLLKIHLTKSASGKEF